MGDRPFSAMNNLFGIIATILLLAIGILVVFKLGNIILGLLAILGFCVLVQKLN